jgi:D-alanine-D-alanine ligase
MQLKDINEAWEYGEYILVEHYIPGREIQVAVLGDQAWGAIEIRPKKGFYDYKAKYTEGYADHLMPAPIHPQAYERALILAKRAHDCLGCEGVTRVDLRYDDTKGEPGEFYVLEVNTQPGLTPLSLVPEIVAYHGMSYGDLLEWMINHPRCFDRQEPRILASIKTNASYGDSQKWIGESLPHIG